MPGRCRDKRAACLCDPATHCLVGRADRVGALGTNRAAQCARGLSYFSLSFSLSDLSLSTTTTATVSPSTKVGRLPPPPLAFSWSEQIMTLSVACASDLYCMDSADCSHLDEQKWEKLALLSVSCVYSVSLCVCARTTMGRGERGSLLACVARDPRRTHTPGVEEKRGVLCSPPLVGVCM